MDGTSRHLSWFDHLAADDTYVSLLGTDRLASSHAIKRFFAAFSFCRFFQIRKLLQEVFRWRLKHHKPSIIVLGLDTTVLDHDDAEKRHGVQPTFKKVKEFQPLQLNWGRYVVDKSQRDFGEYSVILNEAKRNEESILLRNIEFLILLPTSRDQNDIRWECR